VLAGNAETIQKTVVSVDLVGYTRIAGLLQDNIDPSAVAELNSQIQEFIDEALKAAGTSRDQAVMTTTGDGAILLFDSAVAADVFSEALHRASEDWNRKRIEGAKRWFRAGAATGQVTRRSGEDGRYDYAGMTIVIAVRLEAASRPGEFLMDVPTYDSLPGKMRTRYDPEETVAGKRDERFLARRRKIVGAAPSITTTPPQPPPSRPGADSRREAVRLVNTIEESEVEKLIVLIAMPAENQPSKSQTLEQRRTAVLNWAATSARGCGVERLLGELKFIEQMRGSGLTGR